MSHRLKGGLGKKDDFAIGTDERYYRQVDIPNCTSMEGDQLIK